MRGVFAIAMLALMPVAAEAGCLGLITASGECVDRMPTVAEVTAMEHEAPREPDAWRQCLASGPGEGCPDFVFYRGRFDRTEDEIAKQKMSIIVWQTARAAFRCEDQTYGRLAGLITQNFSGIDARDHQAMIPALTDMTAYLEETC